MVARGFAGPIATMLLGQESSDTMETLSSRYLFADLP